ncbi:hypothetical protein PMIN01_09790 [Paraphaeosphaeria minitans]|uniref:Uncharacterized protein n=1 Tax=Paraphaeosphaeria minitans TaxID=565426 RepID=A0A9P6KMM3_9PLEO|nr:hypothetical protein PMIN01_09790 [Paraphaeosphaeria minitans]
MFSRRFYLSLFGAVAWSTTAADTILNILDAVSLFAAQSSLVGLAVTASAFDLGAVGAVTVFSAQYAWTRDGIIKDSRQAARILAISCMLISAGALVISMASMITIRLHLQELEHGKHSVISDWSSSSSAQITVWLLACLSQIALYTSPLWCRSKQHVQSVDVSGPRDSVMSEMRYSTATPNLYMLEATQPSSPLGALPSPTWSNRSSSQSLRSWKDSLQHVVRPISSRSKLVTRPSFNRDTLSTHSDGLSMKSATQYDAFDSWEVDAQSKGAVVQLALPSVLMPSRGTALEPIPGSRPASPARALDGPFPLEDDEELPPPPKLALDISRPPSPAGSEAHIHPLFRSESPTPAPATTPGTSIIASPFANQVITCPARPYSRMRSNSSRSNPTSRASSPALVHQRSFVNERTNSHFSHRSSSRSPSPPSRRMTPPIPDFVLNSSPRSSVSGGQRKVNLNIDTSR